MLDTLCSAVRAAGLAAAAISALVGVSDIILLVKDRVGVGLGFDAMTEMPGWRLVVGGALGATLLPLLVVGMWHLYQGLAPAGLWLALPPPIFLGYFLCLGAASHLSYAHIGATLSVADEAGPAARPALHRVYRLQRTIFLAVAPGLAAGAFGSIWLAAAVLIGPTHYPRWFALINPLVLGLPFFVADRWLPASISGYVKAPFVHLAFAPFFLVSTALLWDCV